MPSALHAGAWWGTAGDSWRGNLPPAPYHRAFFSLPGRYEKRVMGSQVTNRVSIVHERPLPYKALQQWLLGAGERGFKGTLLEKKKFCKGRRRPFPLTAAAGARDGRARCPERRDRDGTPGSRQGGGARPGRRLRPAAPQCPAARSRGPGSALPLSPDGRLQRQSRRKFLSR